jgi:hypothetical protein
MASDANKLLSNFQVKFPEAAKLLKSYNAAMKLLNESVSAAN